MTLPIFFASVLVFLTGSGMVAYGKPNIVIFLADDMGFGDAGSYGHPLIKTPNIDKLAGEGLRMTSFVTAIWCVPSRAQLITGKYMARLGISGGTGAGGEEGLRESETTLAEGLKEAGYATHMIGKWHLGYLKKEFLPTHNGFDTWFGLPYSNDFMKPWVDTDVPLGLYRGDEMVEHPFDQDPLTERYTEEAVGLIKKSTDDQPFFLYMAYAMPHLPLAVSDKRRGTSAGGLYGDVIEELDWSVGEILGALEKKGMAEDTLVFFLSDNGPWVDLPPRMLQGGIKPWDVGTAGILRGSKMTSYEGGARVPGIVKWPGVVKAGGVSSELVGMPDIYATAMLAGGAKLPDTKIDGTDITAFLKGEVKESPREEYFYFRHGLQAVRSGDWKLRTASGKPELFHMVTDPGERFDRSEEMPGKVAELKARMEEMAGEVGVEVSYEAR